MQFITTFINTMFARAMGARDEAGQTLVEYALIIALIAVVAIAAITLVGGSVRDTFQSIYDSLSGATS